MSDVYKAQIVLTCNSEEDRDEIVDHIREKAQQMQGVSGTLETWDMVPVERKPVIEKRNVKRENI